MFAPRLLETFSVLLLTLASSVAIPDCGPAPEGFERWPPDLDIPVDRIPRDEWFRAPEGWIVAPDECRAIEAARERIAAFKAFERHFDLVPKTGAIVDVSHAGVFPDVRAAGAAWVLPWRFSPTPDSKEKDPRADAIRSQIEAQLSSNGRTPDPDQGGRFDPAGACAISRRGQFAAG